MNKRFIIYQFFLFIFFGFLTTNRPFAADCVGTNGSLTDASCRSSYCSNPCQGANCHTTGCISYAYKDDSGACQCMLYDNCYGNCTYYSCPAGETCSLSQSSCSTCNNASTCYTPNCRTSCPAGKTHKSECGPGYVESECSAISQPSSCSDTYTCCTCSVAVSCAIGEENDGNDCTTDSCTVTNNIKNITHENNTNNATCSTTFGTCSVNDGTKTCSGGEYGSCVATDPRTASCSGKNCGSDGCGGTCGTCSGSQTCGGSGTTGVCGCPALQNESACHTAPETKENGDCTTTTYAANAPQAQSCPATCHTDTQYVPNGSCGQTTCAANAPQAQSCPATCHTDTQYVPNGSCGQTTCLSNAPQAGTCPATCHTDTQYVPNGTCGQTTCLSNAPQAGTCPVCRLTTSYVADGACSTNTCLANCSTTCVGNTCDSPPVFSSLVINNADNGLGISVEAGNRNQICDLRFGDKVVNFTVTGTDADGNSDITDIRLRWNGNEFTRTSLNSGVAVFSNKNLTILSAGNTNFEVNITDSAGATTGWVSANRSLKIWNCNVPVSGTLYNHSDVNGQMFSVVGDSKMNFKNLAFTSNPDNYVMTVISNPTTYESGDNLAWGTVNLIPIFNDDLAVTDKWMRAIDLGVGTTHDETSTLEFNVDNDLVSPYSDSPALQIDYSAVVDQMSWFQVKAGGIVAKEKITDFIPITCVLANNCRAAMTIDNLDVGVTNNGIVSAPTIEGLGNCSASNCKYGIPNNWNLTANVLKENYGYKYFYEKYYAKYGQGKAYGVGTSMTQIISDVGGTGVVFVNGNLTINDNNSLNTDEFLMVVASGGITVNSDVDNMAGYFVSDGSILAQGIGSSLAVDGLLYSSNSNVTLSRSYTEKSDNNNNPAVIINYRPDLLFSMPSRLSKILSGWTEGN